MQPEDDDLCPDPDQAWGKRGLDSPEAEAERKRVWAGAQPCPQCGEAWSLHHANEKFGMPGTPPDGHVYVVECPRDFGEELLDGRVKRIDPTTIPGLAPVRPSPVPVAPSGFAPKGPAASERR